MQYLDLPKDMRTAIELTVFDVFAYRLGPDEWDSAHNEFQSRIREEFIRIENPEVLYLGDSE